MFLALLALAGQSAPAATLTIHVRDTLPATYQRAPIVNVQFNDLGDVKACSVEQSSGNSELDAFACRQVQASVTIPTERHHIPAPRSIAVEFVPVSAASAPQRS